MAELRSYTCDRCGADLAGPPGEETWHHAIPNLAGAPATPARAVAVGINDGDVRRLTGPWRSADLCEACRASFAAWWDDRAAPVD